MLLREGMGSGKLREPLVRSRCDRAGAAPRLSASSARVLERGHWRASAAAAEAICAAGKGAAERPGATHGTAPFPVSWGTHGCRAARGPRRSPGRRSGDPQVSENSRGPTFGRFTDRDPHLGQSSPGTPGCRAGTPRWYSAFGTHGCRASRGDLATRPGVGKFAPGTPRCRIIRENPHLGAFLTGTHTWVKYRRDPRMSRGDPRTVFHHRCDYVDLPFT